MKWKDRSNQVAFTRELKIIPKKRWQKEYLSNLFRQSTVLYNHIVSCVKEGKFYDNSEIYKISEVSWVYKDVDYHVELNYLFSHIKMGVKNLVYNSLKSLKALAKNGHKTGDLKFKNRTISVIPLTTQSFKFVSYNHIVFQGMNTLLGRKRSLYIIGYKQVEELMKIDNNLEIGDSLLVRKADGYYLKLVIWVDKEKYHTYLKSLQKYESISLDPGIKHMLTFSTGIQIDLKQKLHVDEKVTKLHQELSRKQKKSRNSEKTRKKLGIAYLRLKNVKRAIHNAIISYLKLFKNIAVQNELFNGWQSWWGSHTNSMALSQLWGKMKSLPQLVVVDRYEPTSKACSNCGAVNRELTLDDRVYHCQHCGFEIERDLNATFNILKIAGLERSSVPVDEEDFVKKFRNVLNFIDVNMLDPFLNQEAISL